MDYPGRIIKAGEAEAALVKALKARLNLLLALEPGAEPWLDPENPVFSPAMKQVVKQFQARHLDAQGRPLRQDGEIGAITWEALFGPGAVPGNEQPANALLAQVLKVAEDEEARKVREVPPNSNRGPQVDAYLSCAGAHPGLSWCCAFVYWCFDKAAGQLQVSNPMVRTAGCLDHWSRAGAAGTRRILAAQAVGNPALVQAGMIFVMDHGGGLGHTGLVEKVQGGLMTTLEGNTDASRTREGGGVYRLSRKLVEVNKGFIDYGSR